MSKIVVIGANHAGTACIKTMLTNYGTENEVVVFDQNSNIRYSVVVWHYGSVNKSLDLKDYSIQTRMN
ncbi:putative NADH oxidase [Streptococcus pasteurianus]|nr:putative NADH oxidase [Streptococcus pasteurianus]